MTIFDGSITVRVNFHNRIEYEKFRKYILKTDWEYQVDTPIFEERVMEFHNTEEFEAYNRLLIYLLQLGFDVYCCRFKMNRVEEQIQETTDVEEDEEFDIGKMVDDIWRQSLKKREAQLEHDLKS